MNLSLLALLVLTSGAAWADTAATSPSGVSTDVKDMKGVAAPQAEDKSPIKFRVGLPAWATSISGEVGIRGAISDEAYIPFSSLTEHLDYVIPGSIAIDYGKWGFLAEGQFVKLSESFSAPISGPFHSGTVGGSIDMEQALADFDFSYKVVETDKLTVAPFIGTRFQYIHLSGSLGASGPAGKALDESGSQAWADPVLGFQASYKVFKPVALMARADVGGFGAASDLTYQFFVGSQVQVSRDIYISGGYRYLYTNYSHNGFTYKVDMNGPQFTVGVTF